MNGARYGKWNLLFFLNAMYWQWKEWNETHMDIQVRTNYYINRKGR